MSVPAIADNIGADILENHAPIVARDQRKVCPMEFPWHAETLQSEKPYSEWTIDVQGSYQANTSSEIWKDIQKEISSLADDQTAIKDLVQKSLGFFLRNGKQGFMCETLYDQILAAEDLERSRAGTDGTMSDSIVILRDTKHAKIKFAEQWRDDSYGQRTLDNAIDMNGDLLARADFNEKLARFGEFMSQLEEGLQQPMFLSGNIQHVIQCLSNALNIMNSATLSDVNNAHARDTTQQMEKHLHQASVLAMNHFNICGSQHIEMRMQFLLTGAGPDVTAGRDDYKRCTGALVTNLEQFTASPQVKRACEPLDGEPAPIFGVPESIALWKAWSIVADRMDAIDEAHAAGGIGFQCQEFLTVDDIVNHAPTQEAIVDGQSEFFAFLHDFQEGMNFAGGPDFVKSWGPQCSALVVFMTGPLQTLLHAQRDGIDTAFSDSCCPVAWDVIGKTTRATATASQPHANLARNIGHFDKANAIARYVGDRDQPHKLALQAAESDLKVCISNSFLEHNAAYAAGVLDVVAADTPAAVSKATAAISTPLKDAAHAIAVWDEQVNEHLGSLMVEEAGRVVDAKTSASKIADLQVAEACEKFFLPWTLKVDRALPRAWHEDLCTHDIKVLKDTYLKAANLRFVPIITALTTAAEAAVNLHGVLNDFGDGFTPNPRPHINRLEPRLKQLRL